MTRSAAVTVLLLLAMSLLSCTTAAPPAGSCLEGIEPDALTVDAESGITPPKPIRRVEPIVPASLLGRDAVAKVEAIIGDDGNPRHVCVTSGDPEWANAVAAALQRWRFEPATLDGKPVAVRFSLTTRLGR